jgi:hypothetical protein
MSLRWRIPLAVIGLMLICLACAIGVYLFAPLETLRVQITVAPTVFAPP